MDDRHDANGTGNGNGTGGENGVPEYGAYAPQGQPSGAYYPYGGAPDANAGANGPTGGQPGGPYAGDGQPQYGQPYAYQPNNNPYGGNPYAGAPYGGGYQQNGYQPNQGMPGFGPDNGTPRTDSPFRLIEEILPDKAKSTIRSLYGVIGVAAVLLGAALLIWPTNTLTVFAVTLGLYFIVSGAIRIVSALVTIGLPGGWRVLDVLVGALLAVGGVAMLKNAVLSGTTIAVFATLTVGFGWILEGAVALAESWRLKRSGWAMAYAAVSIVAGIVLLFSPVSSTVFLVGFAGCALIVMGVSAIVRAFTFGKPRRNAK